MGRLGVIVLGFAALAAVATVAVVATTGPSGPGEPAPRTGASVAEAMREGADRGFARVTGPAELAFPRDHGPHPEFQLEWWYFTGNLAGPGDARYGFQLTFFRNGLTSDAPARTSGFASSAFYMAHFALTNVEGGTFHAFDRFSRAAAGLAGARVQPFRVWTDDWSVEGAGGGFMPLRLRASEGGVGLDVVLEPRKQHVLQGDRGYSRKGADPGNASRYVSFTRLGAHGALVLDGRRVPVEGLAWMDHEWSTSALDPGLVGWDWFALHLEDGRDLMLYQLRRDDGTPGPRSSGTLVGAGGRPVRLHPGDYAIRVLDRWTSPETGVRYPARWRLEVPAHGIELEVAPVLADQELRIAVVYWEGAVAAAWPDGRPAGRGYAELVGYGRGER